MREMATHLHGVAIGFTYGNFWCRCYTCTPVRYGRRVEVSFALILQFFFFFTTLFLGLGGGFCSVLVGEGWGGWEEGRKCPGGGTQMRGRRDVNAAAGTQYGARKCAEGGAQRRGGGLRVQKHPDTCGPPLCKQVRGLKAELTRNLIRTTATIRPGAPSFQHVNIRPTSLRRNEFWYTFFRPMGRRKAGGL